MKKPRKMPRDPNALAARIVGIATNQEAAEEGPAKNPAAVELGRLGGLKGGRARAKKLSATQRWAIAKKAAAARWGSKKK